MKRALVRVALTLLVWTTMSFHLHAQSAVTDLKIKSQPVQNQSVQNHDSLYTVHFLITLSDTLNIDEIKVRVGTTIGSRDVASATVDFQAGKVKSGKNRHSKHYDRKGTVIDLEAGNMRLGRHLFYTVILVDFQGKESEPFIVQR